MIKCSKLRSLDIESDKIWYLEKMDVDYANALKGREDGFFITASELEQLQQEAWNAALNLNWNGVVDFNDYLSSKSKEKA